MNCANCEHPENWHSMIDGACPDADAPHPDSEAAEEAENDD